MHYGYEYKPSYGVDEHPFKYFRVVIDALGHEVLKRKYISQEEYEKNTLGGFEMEKNSQSVVNGVYEHIGNGGVSFDITNENGPTIEIDAGHFGHTTNHMKLFVTKACLQNLATMFAEAAKLEYDEPYCCATESKPTHAADRKVIGNGKSGAYAFLGIDYGKSTDES
jgi:hypothetical protein